MSDELLARKRPRLTLDIETMLIVNEEIERRLDVDPDQPLEKLHGRITLQIVKGRFQLVEVASSRLIADKGRQRNIA
jgi:hypothetical protein